MFDPENLAQNADTVKDAEVLLAANPDLKMEAKYDGFRLLIHVGPDGVNVYTRTGKSQNGKLPLIEAAVAGLPPHTWLDGEIVAFDDKGMPEWGKVQSCMGANVEKAAVRSVDLHFMAFDLLAFNSLDIRALPASERRAALESILPASDHISLTPQVPASMAFHDSIVEKGWEGTIVKDVTKPYASGRRGGGWWKLKAGETREYVIMGFKPGENSFTGMIGALKFGAYKNGVLTEIGACSGMNMKDRQWFTDNITELVSNHAVIEVASMGHMNGTPRHPQYKRLRIDRAHWDITV